MMGNFVIEGCDLSASASHLAGCRSQLLLQKSLFHDRIRYYLNTYLFYDLTFLGGGIPIGRVTEIFGQAGVGKTQLCLQLCANARLPINFGGLNGKSVYLDCHGGFNSKRLYEICNSAQEAVVSSMPIEAYKNAARKKFCSNSMLEDIYYRRIDNLEQINQALEDLVTGILPNSRVKLLVIDRYVFLEKQARKGFRPIIASKNSLGNVFGILSEF